MVLTPRQPSGQIFQIIGKCALDYGHNGCRGLKILFIIFDHHFGYGIESVKNYQTIRFWSNFRKITFSTFYLPDFLKSKWRNRWSELERYIFLRKIMVVGAPVVGADLQSSNFKGRPLAVQLLGPAFGRPVVGADLRSSNFLGPAFGRPFLRDDLRSSIFRGRPLVVHFYGTNFGPFFYQNIFLIKNFIFIFQILFFCQNFTFF